MLLRLIILYIVLLLFIIFSIQSDQLPLFVTVGLLAIKKAID